MKKLLITILILSSIPKVFGAYSIDSAMAFADAQYAQANYRVALKEYQRVSFFSQNSDPEYQLKLANCYNQMGQHELARNYYDQVIRLAKTDSLLANAKIRKISSLIQEHEYRLAFIDLLGIPKPTFEKYSFEFNLLLAICHYGLEEFEQSKKYFKAMVPGNLEAHKALDELFSNKKMLYHPNPKAAYILSIFIPGSGQIYSGDVGDGLNSLLLTGSFVALSFIVAFDYSLLDAFISVLPWYQRYLLGGMNNAQKTATEQRQRRRSNLYKQILNLVSEAQEANRYN